MSSGNIVSHTFTIENDIRRFSEDVNSVYNILARRTDGKGDIEWHKGKEQTGQWRRGRRRRNGWLRRDGALIKRVNGWLQRVIGVFCLDLEAD